MKKDNDSIDIVITWVDGADKDWLKEKNKYLKSSKQETSNIDVSAARYRDWDNLQYIFRGIETYMPWVRKVHLVTWGHVPSWLNKKFSNLSVVKHSEFIPAEFLPTFSANPIELNLHRIKGLADKFIFFNDDTFIVNNMKPSDFFVDGEPCEAALLNRIAAKDYSDIMAHIGLNNTGVINKNFSKSAVLLKHWSNWLNWRYSIKDNLRNLLLAPYPMFPGFYWHHLPAPFKKSEYEEVWRKEAKTLDVVCKNQFKSISDVNQYLIRSWRMASGNFSPCNYQKNGKVYFNVDKELQEITATIKYGRAKMVCINDGEHCTNFKRNRLKINRALNMKLPNKSEYEL